MNDFDKMMAERESRSAELLAEHVANLPRIDPDEGKAAEATPRSTSQEDVFDSCPRCGNIDGLPCVTCETMQAAFGGRRR